MLNFKALLVALGIVGGLAFADYQTGPVDSILRMPHTGTRPTYGSVDLSKSAAVGNSVLPVVNGGTGNSAYTDGQIMIGDTSTGLAQKATLTPGAGISITNSNHAITIAASGSHFAGELTNLGCAGSVSANALTISLKQADGSTDPASGTGAVQIGFRNATVTTGGFTTVSVTGALSTVIPSTKGLGFVSGSAHYIYVYAINNAGTAELAVSGSQIADVGSVMTSVAISGATKADVLYSTSARTSVPVRLICRMLATEATAGTWASNPTEISVFPFKDALPWFIDAHIDAGNNSVSISSPDTTYSGFTLVLAPYSANAQIACASGTAPVGLTCDSASVNESIGIYFTPPSAGMYEGCESFEWGDTAATTEIMGRVVETSATSYTALQDFGDKTGGGFSQGTGHQQYGSSKSCSWFFFADTSARMLRVKTYATGGNIAISQAPDTDNYIRMTVRKLQ